MKAGRERGAGVFTIGVRAISRSVGLRFLAAVYHFGIRGCASTACDLDLFAVRTFFVFWGRAVAGGTGPWDDWRVGGVACVE